MKKEYSKKEIKRILSQDIKVSDEVENRMKETYELLGISSKVTMKYTKKHRVWSALAAVAVLAAGMSLVTFAANKFLSANMIEKEDSVQYNFSVDRTQEAHQIKAEPTYMPDGFVLGEGAYGGKWHKEGTEEGISIFTYNAADLDKMQRTGNGEFIKYKKDSHVKEIDINGMKTDVFVDEGFYVDSTDTRKNIYLFNEKDGYGIWISSYSSLSADELLKVAKGMKVEILEETVPYATDEEIEKMATTEEDLKAVSQKNQTGIPAESIYEIGQEVKDPLLEVTPSDPEYRRDDIGFTVESVTIEDSISFTDYPEEYFVSCAEELAPWVLADGTLKPHERYKYSTDEVGNQTGEKSVETVSSKYVVVKMKAKNYSETQSKWNAESGISIAPDLTVLEKQEDGSMVKPRYSFEPANEGYSLQGMSNGGSSFPVYFDKLYYTEGVQRLKSGFFRPLAAGEELEYTLIYVMDEDQLDNMYLWFFAGTGGTNEDGSPILTPYVRISE